jgi:hypothetical protein
MLGNFASLQRAAKRCLQSVKLSDRDEWVIEAEWPDSTLERVSTFRDHSAAADWIANQSEAWLAARRIKNIAMELRQGAVVLGDPQS